MAVVKNSDSDMPMYKAKPRWHQTTYKHMASLKLIRVTQISEKPDSRVIESGHTLSQLTMLHHNATADTAVSVYTDLCHLK